VSLGVPPYDPHDAASVPATAEFRVQTVCVQSIRDGLESGSPGTLDSDASEDLLCVCIPTIPYTQSGVFGRGVGGRVAADA